MCVILWWLFYFSMFIFKGISLSKKLSDCFLNALHLTQHNYETIRTDYISLPAATKPCMSIKVAVTEAAIQWCPNVHLKIYKRHLRWILLLIKLQPYNVHFRYLQESWIRLWLCYYLFFFVI